jgi:hypothetical protein
MKICFDMDGTIADLYGVENWLEYLLAENVKPYEIAKPLVNMSALARRLNSLQRKGYEVGVISWTSKGGSAEYNAEVEAAKRTWLHKHLASVKFDFIAVVPYGYNKAAFADSEKDVLFDDENKNRENWRGVAYDVNNILEVLKSL